MIRSWRESSGGALVVGLVPPPSGAVVHQAARMAKESGKLIVFAYVEVNSALIELEKPALRLRMSLDPPIDDEVASIAAGVRGCLADAEVLTDVSWTLRVLGGDPARALDRLAREVQAPLIVIGGPRPGIVHRAEGLLSGSVGGWLARNQARPVVIVPVGMNDGIRSTEPGTE